MKDIMLIVANWKMNSVKSEAEGLASAVVKANIGKNTVVICPSFPLLSSVREIIKKSKIHLGAQDCSTEEKGAFTGDVSAVQLADIGAKYVIVGHSERRRYHNEHDETIKRKASQAIEHGLIPIICIGESDKERKAGRTENILINQIEGSIPIGPSSKYVIAYEPVWAIGTGITPTIAEIESAHKLIARKAPRVKILYGGSASDKNCKEICAITNVSGLLVGGASLELAKFTKIMNVE